MFVTSQSSRIIRHLHAKRKPKKKKIASHCASALVLPLMKTNDLQHRASAEAVRCALLRLPVPPRVYLVDAAELVGAGWGDRLYNTFLANGATPLVTLLHACTAILLPLLKPALRASFARFWTIPDGAQRQTQRPPPPDLVVSFVPQLNSVMAAALAQVKNTQLVPSTATCPLPLLTVLTDFAHSPDHPWLQHEAQHVLCGTTKAAQQCQILLPRAKCSQISGMVVHPRFYDSTSMSNRNAALASLGLDPNKLTLMILFGSYPPTVLVKNLVEMFALRPKSSSVNLVVICGRNKDLKRALINSMDNSRLVQPLPSDFKPSAKNTDTKPSSDCRLLQSSLVDDLSNTGSLVSLSRRRTNAVKGIRSTDGKLSHPRAGASAKYDGSNVQLFVTGFTSRIADYMRVVDALVGKPGPGVVSEAFVSKLPCILLAGIDGHNVMAQEQDVVDWVTFTGVGCLVSDSRDAAAITREQVAVMKSAIDRQPPNNAVFEVAEIVADRLSISTGSMQERPTHLSRSVSAESVSQKELFPGVPIDNETRTSALTTETAMTQVDG